MQNALRALVQFYRSGEQSDREKYDVAWVADKASPVDTINGFIEVYLDPRGIKGSWEGLVFSINPEKTAVIKKIGDNAQWFEDHSPAAAKYPQGERQGDRRQRDRRHRRGRRLGSRHAGWHQPAERRAHSRTVR
jgi:dipeptidyl-peptidase-3